MKKRKWKMPKWMEPFRDMIGDTGGNPIEDLVNDYHTNANNNVILAAMIVAVTDQVRLLYKLWRAGRLAGVRKSPHRGGKDA